ADAGHARQRLRALLDLQRLEHCWVKVCGAERVSAMRPPFSDAIPYAQALINAAPTRVLWGTDWPHPNVGRHMPNDGDLVNLLAQMAPQPELQKKILVDNPARLYGF